MQISFPAFSGRFASSNAATAAAPEVRAGQIMLAASQDATYSTNEA